MKSSMKLSPAATRNVPAANSAVDITNRDFTSKRRTRNATSGMTMPKHS